jgi:NAD+ synthase
MSGPGAPFPLTPAVLELDLAAETERIAAWMRRTVAGLRRRGVVVAMSGGIDSSVCAALSARAFGPSKVLGLLLPERDSSPDSERRGRLLAEHLGVPFEVQDIAPTLDAIGCYGSRDEAMRAVFPEYEDGWRSKIVIAGGLEGRINHFRLVVKPPGRPTREARLPPREYLQIVAATNHKQRIRKTLEFYHADRLNYAVVGTPNRLEYDQGFFVRNGDGSADLKPIAHLYKTQVYALARHLGLPEDICAATPTTDTYSLSQGQDEFYFALPYDQMDLALWAHEHGVPAAALAAAIGLDPTRAPFVYADIEAKRRIAQQLHARPAVMADETPA